MDRVRDAGAHEHGNTLALEETLHDERLALIAAVDLDQRGLVAAAGGTLRERDHLAHGVSIITQVCANPFRGRLRRAGWRTIAPPGRRWVVDKYEYFRG